MIASTSRDLSGKVLKVLNRTAETWHRVIPGQVEAASVLQILVGFRSDELVGQCVRQNAVRIARGRAATRREIRHTTGKMLVTENTLIVANGLKVPLMIEWEYGLFRKMTSEQWHMVIETNLNSLFHVTKQVIEDMLDGWGRIINISSVNGQKGQFGQTDYSTAKAGIHGFTMALAQEVASKGVTVNTVSPGCIGLHMN